MAVNKNFVVKNGLEVNTNLIVADAETGKVGIATTTITSDFHVVGGIGVTDLLVTGIATINNLSVSAGATFLGIATFKGSQVNIDNTLFVGGVEINSSGSTGTNIGTDVNIDRNLDFNPNGFAEISLDNMRSKIYQIYIYLFAVNLEQTPWFNPNTTNN